MARITSTARATGCKLSASERMAEAFARWCEKPDLKQAASF
jgi:hypothetical protein